MSLIKRNSKKTIFTRMCIGEAVIALLKKTDLKHLKVLAVAKKAGVSRMTFYKYYNSPEDALHDYLQIIIQKYIDESRHGEVDETFLSYEHILFSLNFFHQYRFFFLTMKEQGLYSILINSVNQFISTYIHMDTNNPSSIYKQYAYAGSLLNSFLLWEENSNPDSAETVASTLYELFGKQKQ